jgi:hypothetical protein
MHFPLLIGNGSRRGALEKTLQKKTPRKDMKAPPSALHNFETRPRRDEKTERIREAETGENKRGIQSKVGI